MGIVSKTGKRTLRAASAFVALRDAFGPSQRLADVDGEGGVDDASGLVAPPVYGVGPVECAEVEGLAIDPGLVAGDGVGGGEGWEEDDEGLEERGVSP